MKKIKLTQGQYALVDNQDYDYLNQWKWHATKARGENKFYAQRNSSLEDKQNFGYMIPMANVILGLKRGKKLVVDHKNRNGLDNRRVNLRIATFAQNQVNRISDKKNKYSKYKGVTKLKNKWMCVCTLGPNTTRLGPFLTEIAAARSYNKLILKRWGKFAVLNKIS